MVPAINLHKPSSLTPALSFENQYLQNFLTSAALITTEHVDRPHNYTRKLSLVTDLLPYIGCAEYSYVNSISIDSNLSRMRQDSAQADFFDVVSFGSPWYIVQVSVWSLTWENGTTPQLGTDSRDSFPHVFLFDYWLLNARNTILDRYLEGIFQKVIGRSMSPCL